MSSSLHKINEYSSPIAFYTEGSRIGIVVADWNSEITHSLLQAAIDTLIERGCPHHCIEVQHVPGTIELTYGASTMISFAEVDVVIAIGCVIRGDTPHFDYVCSSVTQGITSINSDSDVPVIFGVLTVDNLEQALERTIGSLGNKGTEFAEAALKMCDFSLRLQKKDLPLPY